VPGSSRYLQYQLTLSTVVSGHSPVLRGIGFTGNTGPVPQIGELGHHH
jgi:hypothetical protein